MRRLQELEARRRALLERSAEQRGELAARLAELSPGAVLRGPAGGAATGRLSHPLAWAAALAGMLLLGRTRELLTFILWIRSALAFARRAAHLVRVLTRLRAPRAGSSG